MQPTRPGNPSFSSSRAPAALLALAVLLAACGQAAGVAVESPQPVEGTSAPATVDPATPADQPTPADKPSVAPAAPGTSLTACEIVTPADIEAVTGASGIEPGAAKDKPTPLSPGRSECTYQGDWGRLIVELTPEDGANLYDAARGSYDDAVDITGIGDGAFHSAANKRAFVVQGPVAVMLTLFLNGVDPYEAAGGLARAVVAKL